MRRILLALVTLACLTPAADAAAQNSPGQAASRQSQQAQQPKGPASQAQRPAAPRPTALRPGDVRTSRSAVVTRGANAATVSRDAMANTCARSNGRTVCGGGRSSIAGWQAGLPRADYAQRECPDGTFAALARGHSDVVRCMPF